MTYMDLKSIREEIVSALHACKMPLDAYAYWQGMSRQDRDELYVEVQRGNATPEQVADTIRSWAEDATGNKEETEDGDSHKLIS